MGFFKSRNNGAKQELVRALRDTTAVINPTVDVSEFVNAAAGKKFVVIGERHSDPSVIRILDPFLQENNCVFAEALTKGCYSSEEDTLKRSGVYAWNSVKYNRLVERCVASKVPIHGIDLTKRERDVHPYSDPMSSDREEIRVKSWAEYIISNMHHNGQNVILVGALHVNPPDFTSSYLSRKNIALYSPYSVRTNVVAQLVASGIARDNIISIATVSDGSLSAGIYKTEGLEGVKIADFIFNI